MDKELGRLRSKGTTLGADNGNACAYMMGVLARNDLVHPPLECVFTSDEEIGLIGAAKLDANSFTAKRMINMDAGGEDQTTTTVSCAGGIELVMTQKPVWQATLVPCLSTVLKAVTLLALLTKVTAVQAN